MVCPVGNGLSEVWNPSLCRSKIVLIDVAFVELDRSGTWIYVNKEFC